MLTIFTLTIAGAVFIAVFQCARLHGAVYGQYRRSILEGM